jgi:transcriptional regulator GlxA family with amidase domain
MARAAVPPARMADRLGLSPRQLHRRCLPAFGYGPRLLTRILRLGQALDAARSGLPLADVAAACGYADQAHLSRDSRALAGAPPGALLAAERGEP